MIGNGRVQPALIVEPKGLSDRADQLLKDLWPSIEKPDLLVPGRGYFRWSGEAFLLGPLSALSCANLPRRHIAMKLRNCIQLH